MKKQIPRKVYEKHFEPYRKIGVQIWVVTRVKSIPIEIMNMAINLAELEFIKYIRICNETLSASNENYPKRPKVPITIMNHETAIGIKILYDCKYKFVDFFDINSTIKGGGSKMVNAILSELPKDWNPAVLMDWSDGFWEKMRQKYKDFEWLVR